MAARATKPWYKSTTVWINVLPVAALVLEELLLGGVLPKEVVVYVTVLLNIANRLRAPSKVQPLSLK